jgi:hypothetical protein
MLQFPALQGDSERGANFVLDVKRKSFRFESNFLAKALQVVVGYGQLAHMMWLFAGFDRKHTPYGQVIHT